MSATQGVLHRVLDRDYSRHGSDRTPAHYSRSHERIGIFRVFGRDAGYTALYTAYVTSIRCCIPEHKVDLQHLIELLITDKRNNPSNSAPVILSEGVNGKVTR